MVAAVQFIIYFLNYVSVNKIIFLLSKLQKVNKELALICFK